eukprot:1884146-Ditylum_brightwellii.AAC.1
MSDTSKSKETTSEMMEYAAQNKEVQLFYEEIEKEVINAITEDDSSSSSSPSSSLSVSSSTKK